MLANRQWSLFDNKTQRTIWVKSDSQGKISYKSTHLDRAWKPANDKQSADIVAALPARLRAPTRARLVMPPPPVPRKNVLPRPHPGQRRLDDEISGYSDAYSQAWDHFRHLEAFGTRVQLEQASLDIWDAADKVGKQTEGLAQELRDRLDAFSSTGIPFLA